jgi:non-heme chloroperoxidase
VLGNPANRGRAIALTFDQFKYAWANNLDEAEARQLCDTYHVSASGVPLFQAALANFNPFGGETPSTSKPATGPLLIIAGTKDNTAPIVFTHGTYKHQAKNEGVTEYAEPQVPIPSRQLPARRTTSTVSSQPHASGDTGHW